MQTAFQKLSGVACLAGLAYFLYGLSEVLQKHSSWADFRTPAGTGEIIAVAAAALVSIGGALGVNLQGLMSTEPEEPPRPPRRAAAILIAIGLSAGMAVTPGCALLKVAAGQGSESSDIKALQQAISAAELSRQAAEVVKASQSIEIALSRAGQVPKMQHALIQTAFLEVATAMQEATKALDAAGTANADRRHAIGAALKALDTLVAQLGALPDKTREPIRAALGGARALLERLQLAA